MRKPLMVKMQLNNFQINLIQTDNLGYHDGTTPNTSYCDIGRGPEFNFFTESRSDFQFYAFGNSNAGVDLESFGGGDVILNCVE